MKRKRMTQRTCKERAERIEEIKHNIEIANKKKKKRNIIKFYMDFILSATSFAMLLISVYFLFCIV